MIAFPPVDLVSWLQSHYGNIEFSLKPNAYPVSFGTTVAGLSYPKVTQIQNNTDFVLTGLSFSAIPGGANPQVSSVLQLLDAGSGNAFFSDEVFVANLVAPDQRSSLCFPRLILGNSAIVSTLREPAFSAGASLNYLTLIGFDVREMN